MLTYELYEIKENELIYNYYPEGDKNFPGQIVITKDGTRSIIQESEKDFRRWYAHHALRGIDANKRTGTVAWY